MIYKEPEALLEATCAYDLVITRELVKLAKRDPIAARVFETVMDAAWPTDRQIGEDDGD